jgi:hypothetical protein
VENAKQYTYRDPGRLTSWLQIVCSVHIVLLAASLVSYVMQYGFILDVRDHNFTSHDALMSAANQNDLRVQVLASVSLLAIVVSQVSFFFWVYRAAANAHALGAQGLRSAGLTVGFYFIPVASFFMPPIIMNQLFRASRSATKWQEQESSWLIPAWWTSWLVMNVGGGVTAFWEMGAHGIDSLETLTMWLCVYKVIEISAYGLVLLLTARIADLQRAQHELQTTISASFA